MKLLSTITETIKVARPGFWPTHYWFFLLPFAGRDMFGSVAFWLGSAYVCFPLGLLLYGWNDIGDVESDEINPRKNSWVFGARPNRDMRQRLPGMIAAVQVPFVVLFTYLAGARMIGWFLAVVLVNASYNTWGFKKRPVLDLLNQVGYLLIFVLASWLCDVPQLNLPAMCFSALFAMQSHLFGQLMDVDEDKQAGRRSTAILIGVYRAKLLLVAMMLIESLIAFSFFRFSIVAAFMFVGAIFFLIDAQFGPKRYPLGFMKAFFVGWNLVVMATMYFVWRYEVFL